MKNLKRKIVAVIPVKEVSERVPNKNFRSFNNEGESLLDITLKKLSRIKLIDHIYVSSDKENLTFEKYENVSLLKREKSFCNNIKPWSDVINYVAQSIPEDNDSLLLWCHSTTPLFNLYEEALKKFLEFSSNDFNSLVAVESLKEFIVDDTGKPWNYMYGIWHKYSQELPTLYKITGALFINKLSDIKETKYVINTKPYLFEVDSKYCIDIDTEWQYELAQIIYQKIYA